MLEVWIKRRNILILIGLGYFNVFFCFFIILSNLEAF